MQPPLVCRLNQLSPYIYGGEGWFGFPNIWSGQKSLWKWYLTPVVNFGEVRRAQLAKSTPHLHVGAPGSFRSFKVCSDAEVRVGCGKQPPYSIPGKTAALVPEFEVEDVPSAELEPWFLILWWKTFLPQSCSLYSCDCSEGPALGQNTLMMMMMMMMMMKYELVQKRKFRGLHFLKSWNNYVTHI